MAAVKLVLTAVLLSEVSVHSQQLRACGRWLVCDCDPSVNAVYCNMFNLSAMPSTIPASTTILDISNNIIPASSNQFANFYRLKSLKFSSNGLQAIPDGTFNNLKLLEILDLSDNQLISIPCGMLHLLPKVRIFKFAGNPVSSFPSDCFIGMTSIQQLDLSRMKLARISEGAFQWLPTLDTLDVSRNQLQTLGSGFCPNGGPLIQTTQLYGNPWVCDCNIQSLQPCTNITRNIRCAVPRLLRGLAADILLQYAPDRLVCPDTPMAINVSSSDVTAFVGDSVNVRCTSPGVRSDKITWLKMTGDVRRSPTRSVQSGPLLPFARVQLADSGTYICEANSNAWALMTLRVILPPPTTTQSATTLANTTTPAAMTTGPPMIISTATTTTQPIGKPIVQVSTTGSSFTLSGLAVQGGGKKPFDWTLLIIAVSAAGFTLVVAAIVSAVVYCVWKKARWKRRLNTYEGPTPLAELQAFDRLFTGNDTGSQNSTPSSGYDSSPLNPESARSRPSSPAVRAHTPPAVPYVNRHKRRSSNAGDTGTSRDSPNDVIDSPSPRRRSTSPPPGSTSPRPEATSPHSRSTSPRTRSHHTDRPEPVSPRSIRGLAYRSSSAGNTGSNRRTGIGNTNKPRRTARRDKGIRPARKERPAMSSGTAGSKNSLGRNAGDEEHYV